MLNKIWERYFLKEMIKYFSFFIIGIYGLYVLVDYSTRYATYQAIGFSFYDTAKYYLYVFIQRVEILAPFAMVVASVKTLCSLNVHNELIALMASGIHLKRLLRPFLYFALFWTVVLYLNSQFFSPYADNGLKQIHDIRAQHKEKQEGKNNLSSFSLEDGSVILYHNYNTSEWYLSDVYWIRSIDEVYHMSKLYPYEQAPRGIGVDKLVRNEKKELIPQESAKEQFFPFLEFNIQELSESLLTSSQLSITELWQKINTFYGPMTEQEAQIVTTFYRRLCMPWLSFLVFIAVAPFCLKFTRNLPVFLLYLFSMFGTVAFYLGLNAAMVLGENQVVSPLAAIVGPFFIATLIFGWRFMKL